MPKPVRVGIIGSGGIAQAQHMPNYQKVPGVEILAVCDIKPETAKAAAEKFKAPHVFTDYRKLLKLKDIDAVSVCTPNAFHLKPTLAALAAGKHVMVEKPIGMNAREGLLMCRAARQARRILAVGHHTRFDPRVETLKRFIEAGQLGKPYYARAQSMRRRGIPSWGMFISKKFSGGGPLIDIGVHILFSALYLLDFPRPVAVSGKAYTRFGDRPDVVPGGWGMWDYKNYTVEDNAFGFVRFANDVTLSLETSFVANIPQEVHNLIVLGDKGGVQLEPCTLAAEAHGTLTNITPGWLPQGQAHQREIAQFVAAVRGDGRVGVTGEEALLVMQIVDGIYASSKANREVPVEKLAI
jgi:predicted dehydrogenase